MYKCSMVLPIRQMHIKIQTQDKDKATWMHVLRLFSIAEARIELQVPKRVAQATQAKEESVNRMCFPFHA